MSTPVATGTRPHARTLSRFVLVGLTNALIGWTVFSLVLGIDLLPETGRAAIAQVCAYTIGVVWAFWANRTFAFGATGGAPTGQAWRFALVQAGGLASSAAAIGLLVDGLGVAPLPAWLGTMSLVTLANYVLNLTWVFADPGDADRSGRHARTRP